MPSSIAASSIRPSSSHSTNFLLSLASFYFFYYVPNTQFGAYLNSSSIDGGSQRPFRMHIKCESCHGLEALVWIWGYIWVEFRSVPVPWPGPLVRSIECLFELNFEVEYASFLCYLYVCIIE